MTFFLVIVAVVIILVFFVKFLMKKKEAKEREKAELLRKQREEAEILRKKKEEEQWQEDIRTGKVNFSAAEKFYKMGAKLMETGKYDEAIEQFTKAIDSNPRYKDAYCDRGIAYKKKGDCNRAIADYQQGLQLDNNDADIHYNLGLAYMDKKEFLSATIEFQALESRSEYRRNVMMLLNHGIAYLNIGDFHQACRRFFEVLRIDPNNSDARRYFEMAQQKLPYAYDQHSF